MRSADGALLMRREFQSGTFAILPAMSSVHFPNTVHHQPGCRAVGNRKQAIGITRLNVSSFKPNRYDLLWKYSPESDTVESDRVESRGGGAGHAMFEVGEGIKDRWIVRKPLKDALIFDDGGVHLSEEDMSSRDPFGCGDNLALLGEFRIGTLQDLEGLIIQRLMLSDHLEHHDGVLQLSAFAVGQHSVEYPCLVGRYNQPLPSVPLAATLHGVIPSKGDSAKPLSISVRSKQASLCTPFSEVRSVLESALTFEAPVCAALRSRAGDCSFGRLMRLRWNQ